MGGATPRKGKAFPQSKRRSRRSLASYRIVIWARLSRASALNPTTQLGGKKSGFAGGAPLGLSGGLARALGPMVKAQFVHFAA